MAELRQLTAEMRRLGITALRTDAMQLQLGPAPMKPAERDPERDSRLPFAAGGIIPREIPLPPA